MALHWERASSPTPFARFPWQLVEGRVKAANVVVLVAAVTEGH